MKTLAVLKQDMEFNRGLSSLIEVLKNIAVAQYRVMEKKVRSFAPLLDAVQTFGTVINVGHTTHPFIDSSDKPQAVIAVTSDSGLLGGLNMQVVSAALELLKQHPGQLVVVGARGKLYASDSGVPFAAFPGITEEDRFEQAMQLRDYVLSRVLKGNFGSLKVVYPRPVSFTVQKVEMVAFLPFSFAQAGEKTGDEKGTDIIFESDPGDILEYLVHVWVGQRLFEIFGLSRLAEYAARYVHLEESLQKLKDMDGKLRLQYFKVRHELIDRNMRELFSARLLYAS
ncbi:MAG: F0F1 ATP synthase subunit gamma [Candidatus Omnitrophica bacterium]|nr:F0F1 ATP synthase subunit gamma [Candidatus Omnitrophota bacterium]